MAFLRGAKIKGSEIGMRGAKIKGTKIKGSENSRQAKFEGNKVIRKCASIPLLAQGIILKITRTSPQMKKVQIIK